MCVCCAVNPERTVKKKRKRNKNENICVGSVWNYVQFSDNFHVLHLLNDDVRRINKMLEGFIRCNREVQVNLCVYTYMKI